jgi:hypothetical protein
MKSEKKVRSLKQRLLTVSFYYNKYIYRRLEMEITVTVPETLVKYDAPLFAGIESNTQKSV